MPDWNRGDSEGLVSIGTHSLYLKVAGPERKLQKDKNVLEPLIILCSGMGSACVQMAAVQRLVSEFARVMIYDRSGLGKSEARPDPPKTQQNEDTTNENADDTPAPKTENSKKATEDLLKLLQATSIQGPYIMVGHSYGGPIIREFINLVSTSSTNEVAGVVFLDTPTEMTMGYFGSLIESFSFLQEDLDIMQILGITKEASPFTAEEWEQLDLGPGNEGDIEAAGIPETIESIMAMNQYETQPLGNKPLSMIRADLAWEHQKIYDAGVALGKGTEEQRQKCLQSIEAVREQDEASKLPLLKLSTRTPGRYLFLKDMPHNFHLLRADVIVDEIKWVLENLD